MKKFFAMVMTAMMMLCFAAVNGAQTAQAASNDKVAIVLVGSNDFKSTQYFSMIEETFIKKNPQAGKISYGADVQSRYLDYWMDKGYLEEQNLTKDDLLALSDYFGTDKVLVMVVKDPVVEKQVSSDWFSVSETSRASIQINSYLVDDQHIIKTMVSNKEDDSETSELRAKRGAFKKCLKEISKEMLQRF